MILTKMRSSFFVEINTRKSQSKKRALKVKISDFIFFLFFVLEIRAGDEIVKIRTLKVKEMNSSLSAVEGAFFQ